MSDFSATEALSSKSFKRSSISSASISSFKSSASFSFLSASCSASLIVNCASSWAFWAAILASELSP